MGQSIQPLVWEVLHHFIAQSLPSHALFVHQWGVCFKTLFKIIFQKSWETRTVLVIVRGPCSLVAMWSLFL